MNATARAMTRALLFVCVVFAAGCEQDHPTLAPARGGVIRGVVSDGAAADGEITIHAESVGNPEMAVSVWTTADATGRFALGLPNGAYLVFFDALQGWSAYVYHGAQGPVLSFAEADTVWVAGDEQELDFACGRVAFDVGMPESFAGRFMSCGVAPLEYSGPNRSRAARVQDGLQVDVRLVPPGRYRPTLGGGSFGQVFLPPTFDPDAADEISVAAGEAVTYSANLVALTSLSGSVTGSWQTFGVGAPRVYVRAYQQWIANTTVAPDGSFTIELLAGGSLRLQVRIDQAYQWVGGAEESSATVFDVATGQALAGVDYIESGLECVLSGSLNDGRAYGRLYDGQGRTLGRSWSENNSVRFCNLPPGPAYLSLTPPGDAPWLPQYFDRRDALADADPIAIPPDGQIARVEPVLVAGGRICGRILDVLGLPPPRDLLAFAIHAADDSVGVIQEYYANPGLYDEVTGEYCLNQVPDGTFRLRAGVDLPWTWWPQAASFAAAGTVTVEDHAEVALERWQLLH